MFIGLVYSGRSRLWRSGQGGIKASGELMAGIKRRQRNFDEGLLRVLTRAGRPGYLPFYEHIASPGFVGRMLDLVGRPPGQRSRWADQVDFWLAMGYDCIPMEVPPNLPLPAVTGGSHGSEAHVIIRTLADFDKYPWPAESNPIDFAPFEAVAGMLPDGVKIVGGVAAGPFEWVSMMLGIVGISYALADCPELVERMFQRIGDLHVSAVRQLATLDAVGALRQGDDLGFKTATFLPPDVLRKFVLPIYKRMAAEAHRAGKPFILHSCGNLAEIYDDIIDCGVDAKHSFEEVILPVEQFKQQFGRRITPLGGLDVDMICRGRPDEIRAYTRGKIEQCFAADGHWALGTGNSLTDYMPVENYLLVLEEGIRMTGS